MIRWGLLGLFLGDWANLATVGVYASAPFYHLLSVLGVAALASVLIVDSIISPLGTVGVYVCSSARDLFALAEGERVGGKVSEGNRKYGVLSGASAISTVYLSPVRRRPRSPSPSLRHTHDRTYAGNAIPAHIPARPPKYYIAYAREAAR